MPKVKSSTKHKANYFSALESLDAEEDFRLKKANFSLAPSIMAAQLFDETKTFHKDIPSDLPAEELACLLDPPAPAASTTSSISSTAAVPSSASSRPSVEWNLAEVADEIIKESSKLGAKPGESAWDFSSLTSSAQQAEAKLEQDMMFAKTVKEARLAAIHETDRERISEQMSKADISHKQRVRRMLEARKGTAFNDRLSVKTSRVAAKRKLRNKAKHA